MFVAEDRLHEDVHVAIRENPHLSRRQLRFEAADGRVTLHGIVGSYYQKQMAQESLRRVDGVEEIENRLEVRWCAREAVCV